MEEKPIRAVKQPEERGNQVPQRLGYLVPPASLRASNGAEPDATQKKAIGFTGTAHNPWSLLNTQMQIRRRDFFFS